MEVHQLRYFVAVAEEGSFSNAAEREHVSQPSLSQQIHKLEEELNQQLFDRLPRSVVLTEAGRTLLGYARQILSGIAEARQAVTALALDSGSAVARGQPPETGTGSAGCPARHHRPDGCGGAWSYRDTANDAEYGVRERMRGRADCQAGADARADVAAESLAGREQSRRSIPRGSRGSFLTFRRAGSREI